MDWFCVLAIAGVIAEFLLALYVYTCRRHGRRDTARKLLYVLGVLMETTWAMILAAFLRGETAIGFVGCMFFLFTVALFPVERRSVGSVAVGKDE